MHFFRKYHKWIGLFFSFFLFFFSLSGILLNHRREIASLDLPRNFLPKNYHFSNWNNGAIKSSFSIDKEHLLLYGGSGIWLRHSSEKELVPYMHGMKSGADNRIVSNIISNDKGDLFAVANFNLYHLPHPAFDQPLQTHTWNNLSKGIKTKERLTDIALQGDTLIVMSRSKLYVALPPYSDFTEKLLKTADEQRKVSLFRTIWFLHSGELFGLIGVLVVDTLAILLIIMIITGIIIFLFPGRIKRRQRKKKKPLPPLQKQHKVSRKWHYNLGAWTLILLFILGLTGIFLRPPLLIAIARLQITPIPGTVMAGHNPWHDQLRTLRYDQFQHNWLLYTSKGFYRMQTLDAVPQKVVRGPVVSVMGVTVMQQQDSTAWLVGSFSGLYLWDSDSGRSFDYLTHETARPQKPGPPSLSLAISGFVEAPPYGAVLFNYSEGAKALYATSSVPPMPSALREKGRISLWQTSLETHTGRIYAPILGPFSMVFIFFSGLIYLFIIVSGYIVYKRYFKRNKRRHQTKRESHESKMIQQFNTKKNENRKNKRPETGSLGTCKSRETRFASRRSGVNLHHA